MVGQTDVLSSFGAWMIRAIRYFTVTTVAGFLWLVATAVALILGLAFAGIWYVFFAVPVFGDILGLMGLKSPATPATTWTLVFVGVMALLATFACYLIFRLWNDWRRAILNRRHNWLRRA